MKREKVTRRGTGSRIRKFDNGSITYAVYSNTIQLTVQIESDPVRKIRFFVFGSFNEKSALLFTLTKNHILN